MATFSSMHRWNSFLPNLLLVVLSAASFAPLLLLCTPPSSFGWAFFSVSLATLVSSLMGLWPHQTHSCIFFFVAHISLLLFSSVGQAFAFFALSLQYDAIVGYLESGRSPGEVSMLARMEKWAMGGMFALGSFVLVLRCLDQNRWVESAEKVESAIATKKRSQGRTARVRVESVAEVEAKQIEDELKIMHMQV